MADVVFAANDDFGHVIHKTPSRVWSPTTIEELADIVQRAFVAGIPVGTRGHGHSVFGQSQVEAGWLIDMSGLRRIEISDGVAEVEAGSSWRDLIRASSPLGLSPRVLTDYVGLSVGGTLSMAGIGATSYASGPQVDNVDALVVVTGTGEIRRCSPQESPDLFRNVLAGLGQVGILASATIPLTRASDRVCHHCIEYAGFDAMFDDLARVVDLARFEQISAFGTIDARGVWRFCIDVVVPADQALDIELPKATAIASQELARLDHATRLDHAMSAWAASGLLYEPHPWVDVFVPADALPAFARAVIDDLTPRTLGTDCAMILIYPIVAKGAAPLLPLAPGAPSYLFDVLRCVPGASPDELAMLLADNRRIYEDALALGGCMYPIGAVEMSPHDWARHFGSGWSDLLAAKQRYDPRGILGHGCQIR